MFLLPVRLVDSPSQQSADSATISHSNAKRGALRDNAILVSIQRDGQIYIDQVRVAPEDLPAAIRQRVGHGAMREVDIRADAHANYSLVVEALNGARLAGVKNIAFISDNKRAAVHTVDRR
jgi:biopolymer transport protein ExbD